MASTTWESISDGFTMETMSQAVAKNQRVLDGYNTGQEEYDEAVRERERLRAAIADRINHLKRKAEDSAYLRTWARFSKQDKACLTRRQALVEAEIEHYSALSDQFQVDHHTTHDYGPDTAAAECSCDWCTLGNQFQRLSTGVEQADHEYEVDEPDAGDWGAGAGWDSQEAVSGDDWGVEVVPIKAPNLIARLLGKDSMPTIVASSLPDREIQRDYLPYHIQFEILSLVRDILEVTFFEFISRNDPRLLKRYKIEDPRSMELGYWPTVLYHITITDPELIQDPMWPGKVYKWFTKLYRRKYRLRSEKLGDVMNKMKHIRNALDHRDRLSVPNIRGMIADGCRVTWSLKDDSGFEHLTLLYSFIVELEELEEKVSAYLRWVDWQARETIEQKFMVCLETLRNRFMNGETDDVEDVAEHAESDVEKSDDDESGDDDNSEDEDEEEEESSEEDDDDED